MQFVCRTKSVAVCFSDIEKVAFELGRTKYAVLGCEICEI